METPFMKENFVGVLFNNRIQPHVPNDQLATPLMLFMYPRKYYLTHFSEDWGNTSLKSNRRLSITNNSTWYVRSSEQWASAVRRYNCIACFKYLQVANTIVNNHWLKQAVWCRLNWVNYDRNMRELWWSCRWLQFVTRELSAAAQLVDKVSRYTRNVRRKFCVPAMIET